MGGKTVIRHCEERQKKCTSNCPGQKDFFKDVKEVFERGDLIVYPTETLYALGCDPFQDIALNRIYKVKKRPKDMPISLAVSDIKMMRSVALVNELAERIHEKYLPGPVTLILEKKENVPGKLTGNGKKVGIRVPKHPVALKIIDLVGPITATSANLHGQTDPRNLDTAYKQLGDEVALYLDCGVCEYKEPSTIIDVSDSSIKIIRKGVIPKEELYALLEK